MLYDTLIYPHLSYCNIIWGNACKSYQQHTYRLQKRALRICLKQPLNKADNLFRYLNKLSIDCIHKIQIAELVHRYFYNSNTLLKSISCLFTELDNVHHHQTRSLDNLCLFTYYARTEVPKTVWNYMLLSYGTISHAK